MSDLERLADMITHLDAYIECRADEIAAPRIAEIQVAAARDVEAAEAQRQRSEDLVAELRRHLAVRDRRAPVRCRCGRRVVLAAVDRGEAS